MEQRSCGPWRDSPDGSFSRRRCYAGARNVLNAVIVQRVRGDEWALFKLEYRDPRTGRIVRTSHPNIVFKSKRAAKVGASKELDKILRRTCGG